MAAVGLSLLVLGKFSMSRAVRASYFTHKNFIRTPVFIIS